MEREQIAFWVGFVVGIPLAIYLDNVTFRLSW
jgi:hypothetical protein